MALYPTMSLARRMCAICRQSISPTDAVAALASEETSKSLVHISCLVVDLPQAPRMAG